MTATVRIDRSALFRDAWALARKAAADAAEGVRRFLGDALRTAWARAKSALRGPERFEYGVFATTTVRESADGEDRVTVTRSLLDGTVETLGAVLIYSCDYDSPLDVLDTALHVLCPQPAPARAAMVPQPLKEQAMARPDPRQLSLVPLLDAAWQDGDPNRSYPRPSFSLPLSRQAA